MPAQEIGRVIHPVAKPLKIGKVTWAVYQDINSLTGSGPFRNTPPAQSLYAKVKKLGYVHLDSFEDNFISKEPT
ncbi:hypothetical protein V6N12_069881 [Hibiscus sabdariffa]|uniref:Uncharacterized protein n=1 Tax=Hibiscus sabdariffa TaxID=183260 RepID=A0ABR2FF94_9ROSI